VRGLQRELEELERTDPKVAAAVLTLLRENQRFRDALERISEGEGCYTRSYADCCDMHCAQLAREALRKETPNACNTPKEKP